MEEKNIFLNYLNTESQCFNDNIKSNNNSCELCLISDEPLESNYITLNCNHKFNFIEIYNEVVEQKTKKILDNRNLKLNEIKCPYCRTITNKLLPYSKYYKTKLIRGVNYPHDLSITMHTCEYIMSNKQICGKNAYITNFGVFCNSHNKYTYEEEEMLKNVDINKYNFYKNKKIIELKEILKNNKLKLTGKKEDLINRLLLNNF